MPDDERLLRLAFVANPTHTLVERWVNFFARRGHDVTVLDGFGFPDPRGLDHGVRLLRYDARGRLVGVTIVNARWLLEQDEQVTITLPKPIQVDRDALAAAIGPRA